MVNVLNYATLQEAWEGINLHLVLNEDEVISQGGGVYGTEFIAYSMMVVANRAWVDPEFDFGKVLGYSLKKWTTLVKNYVDFNYLDLIKSEVNKRSSKNSKSYNYAFHFANKYSGGKDCLLSLVFSKKLSEEFPTVFFNVRVSEVTCRLIFDFLLVQRICEYIYGEDYPVEINFYAPSMFVTAERFTMFASWYGWKKIKKKLGDSKFNKRVLQVYNQLSTDDPETITWKSHKRCALAIQKDENGDSLKNVKSLKAKDLKLTKLIKNLPIDVITPKQFNKYIKENS